MYFLTLLMLEYSDSRGRLHQRGWVLSTNVGEQYSNDISAMSEKFSDLEEKINIIHEIQLIMV